MSQLDNIISNLSVYVISGFCITHNSSWHEHKVKTYYTLWAVKEGPVFIKINGRQFTANKGDAVLFYPGSEYQAYSAETGCEFVVVYFSLEMGAGLDLFSGLNLAGVAGKLQKETQVFCDKFMRGKRYSPNVSLVQYSTFINYICDVIDIQLSDTAVLFFQKIYSTHKTVIQAAIDYISVNYRTVSVQDVARHVHMSEKRFITNFRKAVKLSPGQYIHQCKMRKAAELLSNSDMKIIEISNYLGFANQYSFSRAFKRTFGDSPSVFRGHAV